MAYRVWLEFARFPDEPLFPLFGSRIAAFLYGEEQEEKEPQAIGFRVEEEEGNPTHEYWPRAGLLKKFQN